MFGIDAPEILIIAVVALIVIGPKELPNVIRTVGRWLQSMRIMAAEFRGHVDDMVRQSELDEIKKTVQDIKENTVLDLQALDPTKEVQDAIAAGRAEVDKATADVNQALNPAESLTTAEAPAAAPPADPAPPAVAALPDATTLSNDSPLASMPTAAAEVATEPASVAAAEPVPAKNAA